MRTRHLTQITYQADPTEDPPLHTKELLCKKLNIKIVLYSPRVEDSIA